MKTRQARHAGRNAVSARTESLCQEILSRALSHHQAGQLDLAAAGYREALKISPQQPDALHLLGMVAFQSGQPAVAETLMRQALRCSPGQPSFWNSLGAVQQAQGLLADAEGSLVRAVTLAPTYIEGWMNLARVREACGNHAREAEALAALTTLAPDDARRWARRGVLASAAGDFEAAVTFLGHAASLAPDDAEIWSNLGAMQLQLGRLEEAEASQRRAFALRPDIPVINSNLGIALLACRRLDEAEVVLKRAVTLAPTNVAGWINLGHTLNRLARYDEAADVFQQALTLGSAEFDVLVGHADALQAIDRLEEAVRAYERALHIRSDHAETHRRLGLTFWRLKRQSDAVEAFQRSLAADPEQPALHSSLIYALDILGVREEKARAERRRWNQRFGHPGATQRGRHPNTPDPLRILRIGYVSGHFRPSSAGYAVLPILEAHDRTRVVAVCYSNATPSETDNGVEQFRQAADLWRDVVHLSDAQLVEQIQADQIDVLVDLSGHMVGNRLPVFAHRPAPVQVTAWGHATGTGLEAIQYFLADAVAVPAETHHTYAEKVVNLPNIICYPPPPGTPAVAAAPILGCGHITFGAFNRIAKVSSGAISAWARILTAVPTARLLIKTPNQDSEADRLRLRDELVARGVDAARIEVRGATAHADHLASHAEIDVMLDSFPHTGGVTTAEALIMGVPAVTLLGEHVSSRVSASLLGALGLGELIAASVDEYVEIAIRLAGQGEWLGRERAGIRDRLLSSPIGDGRRYTQAVEDAYRTMWHRWCAEATNVERPV